MSVNRAILIGNVGKDPQVREVGGVKVASFTLATTDRAYTRRDGTQVPERTEWHNIAVWRGQAEVVEKYVRKGNRVYVEGKITTRSYEKDGTTRYFTEIVAEKIELLGGNKLQEAVAAAIQQQAAAPVAQPYQQPAEPQTQAVFDDLPF